jgi:hypothetical protein
VYSTWPAAAPAPSAESSKSGDDQGVLAGIRKTKVVCTIGPAVFTKERLFALADAGMNVARCVKEAV